MDASPAALPHLSIGTRRAGASSDHQEDELEPLSPTSHLFKDIYIVTVVGLGKPIDYDALREGLDTTLARHPRFSSIRVTETLAGKSTNKKGRQRWVRTTVKVDEHIVVPDLDAAAVSANPDKVLEDYVASLSTLPPMDDSRPLWEVHVLDFATSEAASAVAMRIHHALGDGTSLISLYLACTRSVANPGAPPAMPSSSSLPERRRTGHIYAMPPTSTARSSSSLSSLGFAASVLWYYVALAWHTAVDVARFLGVMLFAAGGDPLTVFTGVKGVESRPKRFVSRSLGLGDVKHIKNTLGCTVNDVLFGVTSAALSRYYFRQLGDHDTKKGIRLKSLLVVNMRPIPGIQALENMMTSGKENDVRWGNRLGYIMVPFRLATHEDPLEYVRQAKKRLDRKKHSLESLFTQKITEMATKFGTAVSVALFHRMVSRTTVLFSNVMGPAEYVEWYGHPVIYTAPSVYGLATALTVHWQSYGDTVRVILALDDEQFPDCHLLLDDFAESLKMIRAATSTI